MNFIKISCVILGIAHLLLAIIEDNRANNFTHAALFFMCAALARGGGKR